MKNKNKKIENHEKEEWGGWKIVSEMLDNSDGFGIFQTSKCYQKLYDFVVAQKAQALSQRTKDIIKEIDNIESEHINDTFDEWRQYKHIRNRLRDKFLKQ